MIRKSLPLPSRRWVLWVDGVQTFCYTAILCFKARKNKAVLLESQWSEAHAALSCCCHRLEGDRVASARMLTVCVVWYICKGCAREKEVGRWNWENRRLMAIKNTVCLLLLKCRSFIFSISSLLEEVKIATQKWEGLLWCIIL